MTTFGISELITSTGGGQLQYEQIAAPAHAAATATELICEFLVGFTGRLRAVYFIPAADVTGQDTNTTHLNVIDKGSDGTGTDELGNYDLTNGNDLTGDAPNAIASGLTTAVTDGDVIAIQAEKVGNGLDVPLGTYVFIYDGGA